MTIDPRHLIEDVPLPADGPERARAAGTHRRRRRALLLAGGTAAIIALLFGLVSVRHAADSQLTTAATAPGGPALDLPAAALESTPVTPPGWRTAAYGFGQISVPDPWPQSHSTTGSEVFPCGDFRFPLVLLGGHPESAEARPSGFGNCPQQPTSFVRLVTTGIACQDCPASRLVNGLRVLEPEALRCATCVNSAYVPELQLRIDWVLDRAQAEQILATLTPSPQAQVLATGALADTTGWATVTDHDVSIRVPPTWPHEPAPTVPAGHDCSGLLLPRDPVVFVGPPTPTGCSRAGGASRQFHDGLWVWTLEGGTSDAIEQEVLAVGDKYIRFRQPESTDLVVLSITTPSGEATVAVGIGPDRSIARSIIRTITIAGLPLGTGTPLRATSTTPATSTPAIGTAPGTTAPAPAALHVAATEPLADGQTVQVTAVGLPPGPARLAACPPAPPNAPDESQGRTPSTCGKGEAVTITADGSLAATVVVRRYLYDVDWHDCATQTCVLAVMPDATDSHAGDEMASVSLRFDPKIPGQRPTLTVEPGGITTPGATLAINGDHFPTELPLSVGVCAVAVKNNGSCAYSATSLNLKADAAGHLHGTIVVPRSVGQAPTTDCTTDAHACELAIYPTDGSREAFAATPLTITP